MRAGKAIFYTLFTIAKSDVYIYKYLTNAHVAITIFSVKKLYILDNSIYNINFIILLHSISFVFEAVIR